MDTNQMLRDFMQKVQQLRAPYTAAIQRGVQLSQQQQVSLQHIQTIQRGVAQLALVYQDNMAGLEDVTMRGEVVEKALEAAKDDGALDPQTANALLEEMLALLANRGVNYEE